MKTPFYIFLLLLFALACSQSEDLSKTGTDEYDTAEYALSLDSAREFVQRYDKASFKIFHQPNPLRAFTIKSEDLLEALGAPVTKTKYDHVRLYIGLDGKHRFRAFLTPVLNADLDKKVAGRDTVFNGHYRDGWTRLEANALPKKGAYVLDFTMPCPSSCDTESDVFHLGAQLNSKLDSLAGLIN